MNELGWLRGTCPQRMIAFLLRKKTRRARTKEGRRKRRLFGCFCCRQLDDRLTDERSRVALDTAERLAEERVETVRVTKLHADAV